jgi:uncharacterized ion transporter superfamily protein YfcC
MGAAIPECTEQKIGQVKKQSQQMGRILAGRSGCLILFLTLVFGIIGAITVCIELFIPFGR